MLASTAPRDSDELDRSVVAILPHIYRDRRRSHHWRRQVGAAICFLGMSVTLSSGSGCEAPLVTGYVPRKLNGGETERRSFYAADFTPDALQPKQASSTPDIGGHRNGGRF